MPNPTASVPAVLDPDALAHIEHLELRARRVVEGFVAGLHRSPFTGFSMEFASYRSYQPGDDLKHLDWKAYGRNDRLLIKQFESETNLTCHLVLDLSASMGFAMPGATGLGKADTAKTAIAAIAHLALGQSDAVSLTVFGETELVLPGSMRDAHLARMCQEISRIEPQGTSTANSALKNLSNRIKRRGMVVLCSDFLDDAQATVEALGTLAGAGHEVVALQILDHAEMVLPFSGRVLFSSLEGGASHHCLPRQLRHQYKEAAKHYVAMVAGDCRKRGASHHLLTNRTSVGAGLQAWLGAREHLAQGGRR